jgi:hypothetical protein
MDTLPHEVVAGILGYLTDVADLLAVARTTEYFSEVLAEHHQKAGYILWPNGKMQVSIKYPDVIFPLSAHDQRENNLPERNPRWVNLCGHVVRYHRNVASITANGYTRWFGAIAGTRAVNRERSAFFHLPGDTLLVTYAIIRLTLERHVCTDTDRGDGCEWYTLEEPGTSQAEMAVAPNLERRLAKLSAKHASWQWEYRWEIRKDLGLLGTLFASRKVGHLPAEYERGMELPVWMWHGQKRTVARRR